MQKKTAEPAEATRATNGAPEGEPAFGAAEGAGEQDDSFKVEDRRHWQTDDDEAPSEVETRPPSIIEEYRQRAEAAEEKLHEYIEAHKTFRKEQDEVRVRLQRDVERRVQLRFGELVGDLLGSIDHLDLALRHAADNAEAAPLAQGVQMVRDQFLATLLRAGVEQIQPDGEEFNPEEAEALRVDPVDDPSRNNRVTETMQPGYRLGETVIRPARVAVGRHSG